LLLNGKVGLISGSTKGIGLAIAKEFAERNGSTVIICSRSDDRSNRAAALLNGKTDIAIDVTSNASIVKSMTRLLVAHEHIDILVNDAGFPFERKIWYKSFDEISTADLKAISEVGAIGSVRLAKAVVRSMLANHHGGVIVSISRTLAISGHFEGAPYTMTKATIVTLTKHIVREHGRRNIQAYTLMLGNSQQKLLINS
jgi:3-oxoacyl-[acyl-carrier protein] reductase